MPSKSKEFFDTPAIRKELHRAAVSLGKDMARDMRKSIKKRDAIASGTLKKSVFSEVTANQDGPILTVGASAKHAQFVEYGTRPHWPPIRAIEKWLMIKGLASGPELRSRAFLTARAIARRGTRPKTFLAPTVQKYRKLVMGRINRAIGRGLKAGAEKITV